MAESSDTSADMLPDALLKALDCPICKEKFKVPKVVTCGHIFCSECLVDFLDQQQSNYPPCPLCRKNINVPEKGVHGFQTQTFYEDLIRHLEDPSHLCAGCNSKPENESRCPTCKINLCQQCQLSHTHSETEASHYENVFYLQNVAQPASPSSELQKRVAKCPNHDEEEVKLFCLYCKSVICSKCRENEHERHEIQNLSETAVSCKKDIFGIQSKLISYVDEAKEALSDLDKIKTEYIDNVKSVKSQIEAQVQKLVDHLQNAKQSLLDELSSQDEVVRKRLLVDQEDLETIEVRASSLKEHSDLLTKYGTDAEVTTFKGSIQNTWDDLQQEKIKRYGQGFRVGVQFFMREGMLDILAKDIGTLKVTQNLSPWSPRKHIPLSISDVTIADSAELEKKITSSRWLNSSQSRSEIFSKLVDPRWTLETFKICKDTGMIAACWVQKEGALQPKALARLSRAALPPAGAEIITTNERGEVVGKLPIEKLPDQSMMRVAIVDSERLFLAIYPGNHASLVLGFSHGKASKRLSETEGIFVAVLHNHRIECGEVRKIPIPIGQDFDFDITNKGFIVIRDNSSPDVQIYSPGGRKMATDHGLQGTTVVKVMESIDHGITVIGEWSGKIICEHLSLEGKREVKFDVSNDGTPLTPFQLKDACFDRYGNMLFHLGIHTHDLLYLCSQNGERKEYLSKPDMFHKIDKLTVLPDGRICIFDQTECVLMTLRYLP